MGSWKGSSSPKRMFIEDSQACVLITGILTHRLATTPKEMPKPVDILVTGSVPAGSGLSSSAAMVVASTLAFLAVNNKITIDSSEGGKRVLTKGELVEMAVENEKRVGVNSGG